MKPTNIKAIGIGACLIVFALFLLFARRAKYQDFHEYAINGTVDTIYRYKDYVMFTVNRQEFRIIPISVNNSFRFDWVAKIGDTISKSTNHDTLKLVHHSNVYLYTVQKW